MKLEVDFSARAITYTDEEVKKVLEVMTEAPTLTQGEYLTKFEAKAIQSAVDTTSKIEDLGKSFLNLGDKIHSFDDIDAKMKAVATTASEAQNNSKGIFDFNSS